MQLSEASKNRLLAWWDRRENDRPCILASTRASNAAKMTETHADAYWRDPDVLVRETYERLEGMRYFGEALPLTYIDYGASAVALQFGAQARWTSKETIWADPSPHALKDLPSLIPSGEWLAREKQAMERAIQDYAMETLIGCYCLGAPADTTAALIGTENLLYALIDEPDDVRTAFEGVKREWIRQFAYYSRLCQKAGGVLNGWHGIWSPEATAPIQEDFSYMVGKEMYDAFCLPHICDIVESVPYSFYHLDGIGALKHLPSLCGIDNLRAIQWQPGEGHMNPMQWVDVIRAILDSGKSCQIYAKADEIEPLLKEVDGGRMLFIVYDEPEKIYRLADRYQLEENEKGA